MKIAYNPLSSPALSAAPAGSDIIFDLPSIAIYARGVRFKGTDTTYNVFKKHTSSGSGGYNGLVPVPSYTTTSIRYLREDGTWQVPIPQVISSTYTQLSNEDFDTLMGEGRWYFIPGSSTTTNGPTGVNNGAELYVGRNAYDYRYQKVITDSGVVWFRYWNATSWQPWIRWYTDANTDNNVLQSVSSTANFRPLIIGYNNSADPASLTATVTNQVYTANALYAQPSTGTLFARIFDGDLRGNADTSTSLGNVNVGNAALPVYFAAGKPVACVASSLFSVLTNDNKQLSVTVAGQNRKLTINYSQVAERANALQCFDIRSTTPLPKDKLNNAVTSWFNYNGTLDTGWWGGLTVKGWGGDYEAWEIAGPATSTNSQRGFFLRSGQASTWNSWERILTSANTSLTTSADDIIIKINNVTATLPTEGSNDGRYVNVTGDTMTGYLTINTSGAYVKFGCQNGSYAHYETSATVSHYFNKTIDVNGVIRVYNTGTYMNATGFYKNGSSNSYTLLGGGGQLAYSTDPDASTLVQRTSSGYIFGTYFNSAIGDESPAIGSVFIRNTSDNYIRRTSYSNFISNIGTSLDSRYVNITGDTMTGALKFNLNNNGDANVGGGDGFKLFYNHTTGSNFPERYSNVASFLTEYTGFQLASQGGEGQTLWFRKRQDNGTWHPWHSVLHTGNYTSTLDGRYVSITGDTMTGALNMNGRLIINPNGYISPTSTSTRRSGMYGVYDSYKTGHIWSMGASYVIPEDGTDFGNLYGLAYKHTNNATGGIMAGGHQAVWCTNGVPKAAMGENGVWAAGGFFKAGHTSAHLLRADGGAAAFNWSGQGGQPAWLWGGNNPHDYYVYDPRNFNVASAEKIRLVNCFNGTTNNDLWSTIKTTNSSYIGTMTVYEVYNDGGPDTYGEVLDIVSMHQNHWQPQLWFGAWKTGSIRHRNKDYNNDTWGDWYTILDTNNYTGTLDTRYVTSLGTSGNSLTWVKNGATNSLTVPYAERAEQLSSYGQSPNNSHPGYGARIFYSWDIGQANNATGGYSNGITIGSNPGDTAYGFQIVQNMWDDRTYTRRYNYGWQTWRTLAWTSDILNPADYYWANIKVSTSSSTGTSPTFSTAYASNWFRTHGQCGWYSESYGGGIYMVDSTWIRTYGSKYFYCDTVIQAGGRFYTGYDSGVTNSMSCSNWFRSSGQTGWINESYGGGIYQTTSDDVSIYGSKVLYNDGSRVWGIGGHNCGLKLYQAYHIGINLANNSYTWGIYSNNNGNLYFGRRNGNVNDSSGSYYHTLTTYNIQSPGFYHTAIGSDAYVLLAGGGYKNLADFAKGNGGSSTQGIYISNGIVNTMTYSLKATVNSGFTNCLAQYVSNTEVSYFNKTVGNSNTPIYLASGVPTACSNNPSSEAWYKIIYNNGNSATFYFTVFNFPSLSLRLVNVYANIPRFFFRDNSYWEGTSTVAEFGYAPMGAITTWLWSDNNGSGNDATGVRIETNGMLSIYGSNNNNQASSYYYNATYVARL